MPFEFPVFLCVGGNLTCILGSLNLQMSGQTSCQGCGPVSDKTVGTMVDVCQVMIDHTIICKIQVSRLNTLVRNLSRWNYSFTEILTFLTMKMELPSLLSDSPFLSSKSFLFFFDFQLFGTQNRDPPTLLSLMCFYYQPKNTREYSLSLRSESPLHSRWDELDVDPRTYSQVRSW